MSVRLRESRRIAGAEVGAGDLVTLSAAQEADLVQQALADPVTLRWPSPTCVLLGDSLTFNNTYTGTGSIANGQRGYMTWANILLGTKRLHILNNAGNSGENTTQMRARVAADVLAHLPQWCVVLGGVNDLFGDQTPVTTPMRNLDAIYAQLLGAGIKVVACSVLPVGSTHSAWSHQNHTRLRNLNQWIAARCASTPGMVFADFYGAVINPTDTSANPKSGYYWDTPAVHPSALGAYYCGLALKNALSPYLPDIPDMLASVVDDWAASVQTLTSLVGSAGILTATLAAHKLRTGDVVTVTGANEAGFNGRRQVVGYDASTLRMRGSGAGTATGTITISPASNLYDEGLFQGSGGTAGTGVTGPVATGWTVERDAGTPTAACTVDARADGIGNDQTIVITSGANADAIRLRGPDPFARAFSGQTVYVECPFSVASITALNCLQLKLQAISGGNLWRMDGGHLDFTDAFPTVDYSGLLRTPPLTIPAGALTRLRADVIARFSGAGGATVKVGRARLVVVNDFPIEV